MATRVFFLNKLKDGVDPAEYERWLVERDYPYARSLASIKRYEVTPNGGALDGFGADLPFDYLEVVDITGIEEYGAELADSGDFFAEWSSYVDQSRSAAVFGDTIE